MTPRRVVAGRYRLEERIGSGAMGVVWRGTDERLGRVVAVKQVFLNQGLDESEADEVRQRTLREGRIAARLQHPHAISVFDASIEGDEPWLVMEYLPSRSLAAMLGEHGPLEPRLVARIGRQVADALDAAHQAGIVHRDVKPGNVLIGADGTVKITDFGISARHRRPHPDPDRDARRDPGLPGPRGRARRGLHLRLRRLLPRRDALRRRRGHAALRVRRQRARAAALRRGRGGEPAGAGGPAHRPAHAPAARRPHRAPDPRRGPPGAGPHRTLLGVVDVVLGLVPGGARRGRRAHPRLPPLRGVRPGHPRRPQPARAASHLARQPVRSRALARPRRSRTGRPGAPRIGPARR